MVDAEIDKAQDSTVETLMEVHCEWICDQLRKSGRVTKKQFVSEFSKGQEAKLGPDWSRAMNAVKAILKQLSIEVEERGPSLVLKGTFEPSRYKTKNFQPNQDADAKQRIGELVARFLKDEDLSLGMSVFLGSGSTIFRVGCEMCKYGPYEQLFATVNLPLANLLCEHDPPPVDQISIPEAVLETKKCRFATMQKPGWTPATVIVGADGCHYDSERGEVFLYAMDEAVARNTNLFVQNATDLVIVCLASRKIGFARNMGPLIFPPRRGVRRALVTDKPPFEAIAKAFEKNSWVIITEYSHWVGLPKLEEPSYSMVQSERTHSTSGTENRVIPFNSDFGR